MPNLEKNCLVDWAELSARCERGRFTYSLYLSSTVWGKLLVASLLSKTQINIRAVWDDQILYDHATNCERKVQWCDKLLQTYRKFKHAVKAGCLNVLRAYAIAHCTPHSDDMSSAVLDQFWIIRNVWEILKITTHYEYISSTIFQVYQVHGEQLRELLHGDL